MNLMLFERERFFSKRNVWIMALLMAVTMYFTVEGGIEYRRMLQRQQLNQAIEAYRIANYITYAQYAAFGFHVVSRPSPLQVFFFSNGFLNNVSSSIDSTEMVNVYKDVKGKNALKKAGRADFGNVVYILGSLFSLITGVLILKSKQAYITPHFVKLTFIRHLYLSGFIIALLGINFILAAWLAPDVIQHIDSYAIYSLYLYLYFSFFFLLGVLCLRFFYVRRYLIAFLAWFIFIFIIPEAVQVVSSYKNIRDAEAVNREKFEKLLSQEKEFSNSLKGIKDKIEYQKKIREMVSISVNNIFQRNKEIERAFNESVEKAMRRQKFVMAMFPSTFYQELGSDLAGTGNEAYINFVRFVNGLRERFIPWYLERQYSDIYADKKIEPFTKPEENIFRQSFSFNASHAIGFALALLFNIALCVLLLYRPKQKPKEQMNYVLPVQKMERGKFYFILASNPADRARVVAELEHRDCPIIRPIVKEEYYTETTLRSWIWYQCHALDSDYEQVMTILLRMHNMEEQLNKPMAAIDAESINFYWLAVNLLRRNCGDMIAMDHYLYRCSHTFEENFRTLHESTRALMALLYISPTLYETRTTAERPNLQQLHITAVPPDQIALR